MEDVAAALGDTPGWFQLYPPNDRELTREPRRTGPRPPASRPSSSRSTRSRWAGGPATCTIASFPQLQGLCLANYFSDPVFRSRLAAPPEEDPQAATGHWSMVFGNQRLTWDDLAWLRSLTTLPLLLKGICSADDARRSVDARRGRHLLLQPRRPAGQRRAARPRLPAPSVVDAAGDLPVVFDSGVRSGPDVVKALALGATRRRRRPAVRLRARRRRAGAASSTSCAACSPRRT